MTSLIHAPNKYEYSCMRRQAEGVKAGEYRVMGFWSTCYPSRLCWTRTDEFELLVVTCLECLSTKP